MSRLIHAEYYTECLPEPLQYAALLPDAYDELTEPLPLLYVLHGGGESRDALDDRRPIIESLWQKGTLPPVAAVMPSAQSSQYMDYRDGSQRWESVLTGPFLTCLRERYRLRQDRQGTLIFGISMGGIGALRMGLKYPELFGGIAALAPGVMPSLTWEPEVQHRNFYWQSNAMEEMVYGRPIDRNYWQANNPAAIAIANREKIRSTHPAIYIECGNEDTLLLHEGVEFLHRVLWDQGIAHEYHLVHGVDHVGASLAERSCEGLEFLGRLLTPVSEDHDVAAFRKRMRRRSHRERIASEIHSFTPLHPPLAGG